MELDSWPAPRCWLRLDVKSALTASSTHAEVVAASTNSNDALWTRGYLREIGLPQDEPTPFMVDAKNVLTLVQNP